MILVVVEKRKRNETKLPTSLKLAFIELKGILCKRLRTNILYFGAHDTVVIENT